MKKITAEFDFDIDDQVRTVLGDHGVVVMLGIDDNRNATYCVRTAQGTAWYKAMHLWAQEDSPR